MKMNVADVISAMFLIAQEIKARGGPDLPLQQLLPLGEEAVRKFYCRSYTDPKLLVELCEFAKECAISQEAIIYNRLEKILRDVGDETEKSLNQITKADEP